MYLAFYTQDGKDIMSNRVDGNLHRRTPGDGGIWKVLYVPVPHLSAFSNEGGGKVTKAIAGVDRGQITIYAS